MHESSRPHQAAAVCLVGLTLVLLCCSHAVQAASPKVACAYNDRYCQLRSRYIFGSTVVGEQAYFHGGLQANDATVPMNGSVLEMVDLRDMSPYVMQVQPNDLLNTSRYRHHLVNWNDNILAVGGQVDDLNGQSHKVMNILQLDMASRSWSVKRNFTQSEDTNIVFEQALVLGDTLCVIAQSITTTTGKRFVVTFDLKTNDVPSGGAVFVSDKDWSYEVQQLAAVTSMSSELPVANQQYLVVQAARIIPTPDPYLLTFKRVFPNYQGKDLYERLNGGADNSSYTFLTPLRPMPNALNATILGMSMMDLEDTPSLVWWIRTRGNFSEASQVPLNALVIYSISMPMAPISAPPPNITLSMKHLFVAVPSGIPLSELRSIDLPVHGRLAVGPGDIGPAGVIRPMPFIGRVTPVSDLDWSNVVNVQKAPGGFIVRGNAKPEDPNCIPGDWRPFVLRWEFGAGLPQPRVTGASNYTWCAAQVSVGDKPSNFSVLSMVQATNRVMAAGRQLQRVEGAGDAPLMMLFTPVVENSDSLSANIKPVYLFTVPIQGVFVDMQRQSVLPFPIAANTSNYLYPVSTASCITRVPGRGLAYLEYGGKDVVFGLPQAGVSLMELFPAGGGQRSISTISRMDMPARASPAMACAPDGRAWAFGGLATNTLSYYSTSDFNSMAVTATAQAFNVSIKQVASLGQGPSARHSHAMMYLPPAVVGGMGMAQGALLMYGGTIINSTDLLQVAFLNASDVLTALLDDTWLFDLGGGRWVRLAADGEAPPPMMYHAMALHGKQVMLFGGRTGAPAQDSNAVKWSLVRDVYVLDFSLAAPRWRRVEITSLTQGTGQDTAFPASSIVPLPETQSMALMYMQSLSLAPLPRSVQLEGSAATPQQWSDTMQQLTSGDWVRLAPPGGAMAVSKPLLVPTGITVTGIGAGGGGADGDRPVTIQCQAQTGIVVRSAHVILENMTVTGCNVTAVDVHAEPTGQLGDAVVLRNITLRANIDAGSDAGSATGAALTIRPWAAAVLEDCVVRRNLALLPYSSVVHAMASSNLTMDNVVLADNNASALLFEGEQLLVMGSTFSGNSGFDGAAVRMMLGASEADGGSCSSRAIILYSSFVANTANARGGALLVGPKVQLYVSDTEFALNKAQEGGAIHVAGEGCLSNLQSSNFTGNNASAPSSGMNDQLGNGGAMSVLASACDMQWGGVNFEGNSASASGGAVYVSQTSNKTISSSDTQFINNTATRGHGGALFLGVWASDTTLSTTRFLSNRAGNSGGALAMLGITSRLILLNSFAAGNVARQLLPWVDGEPVDNQGGAVYILGNSAALTVDSTTMTGNSAFEGGAISHSSAGGTLQVFNSSLTANTAQQSGGAVHASAGIACAMLDTTFGGNQATSSSAVGGALVCDRCASVAATNCTFTANSAPYGGGAALLQPQGASSITASSFTGNSAQPGLGQAAAAAGAAATPCPASSPLCRRRLMQQALAPQAARVHPVLGGGSSGSTNGTSVATGYQGGGGLFVQLLSAPLTINNTRLVGNSALNGGGMVALTDTCLPGASSCMLTLLHTNFSANNATSGAGGAMLVTDLSRTAMTCGPSNRAVQLSMFTATPAGAACMAALQGGNAAGGYGAGIATGGSRIMICTGGFSPQGDCLGQAPNTSIATPPGRAFSLSAVILDQWGRRVVGDINDANMLVSVALVSPPDAQVVFLGNTTQATNGAVRFSAILMYSKPAQYELEVTSPYASSVLRPARLDVNLRTCIYGEVSSSINSPYGAECQQCVTPSYSFDPSQKACQLCSVDTPAQCNGSTKLPLDGYWHSSSRSNQVHKCLFPRACTRSANETQQLIAFTQATAAVPTAYLNDTFYMDGLCAEGYVGPLCGSCAIGYGRRGQSCVKCPARPVNSFVYFLLCLYLFLLVLVAGFMHVKQVQRRQLLALLPALPPVLRPPGRLGGAAAAAAKGASAKPALDPLFETEYGHGPDRMEAESDGGPERVSSAGTPGSAEASKDSETPLVLVRPMAAAAGGSGGLPDTGSSLDSDQMLPSVFATAAGLAAANATLSPHSEHSRQLAASRAGMPPVWRPFGAAPPGGPPQEFVNDGLGMMDGAEYVEDDTMGMGDRLPAGSMQPTHSGGSSSSGGRLKRARSTGESCIMPGNSLLSRLFGVDPIGEKMEPEAADKGESGVFSSQHAHAQAATGPSSLLGGSGGSAAALAGGQQQQRPSTSGGGRGSGGRVVRGGRGYVNGRRFWVADLLKLLITHVQMLGVLRNLQLNWPESVRTILIYFDQTQATTTWISIDCSLSGGQGRLPVAVQRVLVQLLFPVGALIVAGAYWGGFAAVRRLRRRPLLGFKPYVMPRLVLTVVLVLFYLYPTVTNVAVGLFSCTPIDNPAAETTAAGVAALRAVGTYWNQDTSLQCFSRAHSWLAYGLGLPALVLFALGFPLGLALLLLWHRKSLEEADVDLMYGFLYDSYRRKYYFWESVILLEKLALVMSVTLMQRFAAAAQVLLAMAVIFVAAILQITFQPFGCRLLDTMQRGSLYTLQATLFLLMMAAITEISSEATKTAAIVVIFLINICLVALFIYVLFMETRRFVLAVLDRDGKGQVAWDDVKHFMRDTIMPVWSGKGMRDQGAKVAVMGRAALADDGTSLRAVHSSAAGSSRHKARPGKQQPPRKGQQAAEPVAEPGTAGRVTVINPTWNPLSPGASMNVSVLGQQPHGDDAA